MTKNNKSSILDYHSHVGDGRLDALASSAFKERLIDQMNSRIMGSYPDPVNPFVNKVSINNARCSNGHLVDLSIQMDGSLAQQLISALAVRDKVSSKQEKANDLLDEYKEEIVAIADLLDEAGIEDSDDLSIVERVDILVQLSKNGEYVRARD